MASYIVELQVRDEDKDLLLAELMGGGTTGVSEVETSAGQWLLRASFDTRAEASAFSDMVEVDDTDWVRASRRAWASRKVGEKFFFAPSWSEEETPEGRWRIDYQDGAACGSGEHPSTRQALEEIEAFVKPRMRVLDLGCGAGILSLGAKLMGAKFVLGVDLEEDSCQLTRNLARVPVVRGSSGCLRGEFDLVVANISPSVLLDLADDILQLTKPGGRIVLAGFGVEESPVVSGAFGKPLREKTEGEWSCLVFDSIGY